MIKVSDITINGLHNFFIDEMAEKEYFDCILDQLNAECFHYSDFNNITHFDIIYV